MFFIFDKVDQKSKFHQRGKLKMTIDNHTEHMEGMVDDALLIHANFIKEINFLYPFAKKLDALFKELRPESFEACDLNFTQTLESVQRYSHYLNSVMIYGEEEANV